MAGGQVGISANGGRRDSCLALRLRPPTPCPHARAGDRGCADGRHGGSGPPGDAAGDPGRRGQFAGNRLADAGQSRPAGPSRPGSPGPGPDGGTLAKGRSGASGGPCGGYETPRGGRASGFVPPQPGDATTTKRGAMAGRSFARRGMALSRRGAPWHGSDPEPGALGRRRRVRAGGPKPHDRHQRARARRATLSQVTRQHRAPALAGGGV